MSTTLTTQSTLARLATSTAKAVAPAVVVVDAELAAPFLAACQRGDIDAAHVGLINLQQRYPNSVSDDARVNLRDARVHQPVYDVVGHGLVVAATQSHVETVEFLLSSTFGDALRDGICRDAHIFPPFQALCGGHELERCVGSVRFVCFAALACVDQLAMPCFQLLVETRALWGFEASLCLSLAMRRAFAVASSDDATSAVSSSVAPMAFHPFVVLLARHFDYLIDEIRSFHEQFRPQETNDWHAAARLDRAKALQATLLYEIVLDA